MTCNVIGFHSVWQSRDSEAHFRLKLPIKDKVAGAYN